MYNTCNLLCYYYYYYYYYDSYLQIDDWRNMMLYFLVELHRVCFHLLSSEQFDALGYTVSYKDDIKHSSFIILNFYLILISYISNLIL